jgi:hypothetical protein
VESKQLTPINEKPGQKISYAGAEYSRDGKGIYVSCDEASELQQLKYYDLEKKVFTQELTKDIPWDVEDFDVSPDGSQLR